MISMRIPYPISTNRYWRKGNNGRIIVSDEALAYKQSVRVVAHYCGIEVPFEGLLQVEIYVHPVMPRTWARMTKEQKEKIRCVDLDNCLKIPIDSLNGVAWNDDSQIRKILIERCDPVMDGCLIVEIERYSFPSELVS